MSDSRSMEYRPDIDGLRAVAVLGVLLYHLRWEALPGGFAGVDVFFVISGFLITRLIRSEVGRTGRFNAGNFYIRRARRLLPAMFVVVAATLGAGVLILPPDHLERLGGAALHAVLSLSNFYFWSEAGYFDADAHLKPLLHTWSLAIEEQFYLIWPVVLALMLKSHRKWLAPIILVLLGGTSLLANHIFADGESALLRRISPVMADVFSDGPSTLFFLLPFRIYEFAIGALLVWVAERPLKNGLALDGLLIVGLGLIVFSFTQHSDAVVWPGFAALIPCLGTALCIYAGQAPRIGRLLNNPVAVWIGLISYSLYLVHWPIIVFTEFITLRPLSPGEQVAIGVLSVLAAAGLYRFVETPLRRPAAGVRALQPAAFGLVCAAAAILIVLPASNMWANHGWSWRYQTLISKAEVEAHLSERFTVAARSCQLTDLLEPVQPETGAENPACKSAAKTRIAVFGDSHAVDALNTLDALYRDRDDVSLIFVKGDGGNSVCVFGVAESGLIASQSRADCPQRAAALNSDIWQDIDVLVLDVFNAQSRLYPVAAAIKARNPDLELLVLGPYIGTRPHTCADLANRAMSFSACRDAQYVTRFGADPADLSLLPEDHVFIDRTEVFCDRSGALETCETVLGAGTPIFVDGDHLTYEASVEFARRIAADHRQLLEAAGLPLP